MATYTHRERTIRHLEWVISTPAAYAELCKAVSAAERAYRADHGLANDAMLSDDALTVTHGDDEVVITYAIPVTD